MRPGPYRSSSLAKPFSMRPIIPGRPGEFPIAGARGERYGVAGDPATRTWAPVMTPPTVVFADWKNNFPEPVRGWLDEPAGIAALAAAGLLVLLILLKLLGGLFRG